MIDTELSVSRVSSDEAEWIANLSTERCVEEISELIDWKIYLGLGENFRKSMAKLFRQNFRTTIRRFGRGPHFVCRGYRAIGKRPCILFHASSRLEDQ
jgi:hypothetical protein